MNISNSLNLSSCLIYISNMFDLYSTWCHLVFNLSKICYLKIFLKTNKKRIGEAILTHMAKGQFCPDPIPHQYTGKNRSIRTHLYTENMVY